jgi:D-aminoacyl-tRNA deacylase
MLAIVVSEADPASVHIGEHLLDLESWDERHDDSRPDAAGGGTVYATEGVRLREFEGRHLDMERPADAFEDPTLVVFASKHAGETGKLLTAHHPGNFGPAEHGGRDNELSAACPNAHAAVLDALDENAPAAYEVGMECTHHGPSDVGAPSLFVEVGSSESQWEDPAAARAVAKAILALRDVPPRRSPESDDSTADADRYRRQLVGLGGGHYCPRFERIVRETDWAFGHIAADWGLAAMDDLASDTARAVLEQAFEQSRTAYALVDGDRPDVADAVADLGFRPVSETWVRETAGVSLDLVTAIEAAVRRVDEGLRFGSRAREEDTTAGEWTVTSLSTEVLDETFGIDREATASAVDEHSIAYATAEGGTRPIGSVVLDAADDREDIIERLLAVLGQRYDTVERDGRTVRCTIDEFDPERARTLGVPDGPAFGRLADGQAVEVDGEEIPPEVVHTERERTFTLED